MVRTSIAKISIVRILDAEREKHDQGWIGSDSVGLTPAPEILCDPALPVLTYTPREPESSGS